MALGRGSPLQWTGPWVCCCDTGRSKEALHTVQAQVEKVIVSVQSFYGKEQTEERRKTEEFLQALLAPEGPTGADVVAAAAVTASRSGSRALLGEQLDRSRQALMEVERRNEVLASQVQELKEKIRGEEQNADRLSKQLLLLGGSQNPALAATEEQQQREMQEQLRQLYIQYARRSALCDTLTASVEAMAGRAEAAAAQNRLRLQEAMQQLQLEQAAAASATETHTNVRHKPNCTLSEASTSNPVYSVPMRVGACCCCAPECGCTGYGFGSSSRSELGSRSSHTFPLEVCRPASTL